MENMDFKVCNEDRIHVKIKMFWNSCWLFLLSIHIYFMVEKSEQIKVNRPHRLAAAQYNTIIQSSNIFTVFKAKRTVLQDVRHS